MEGATDFLWMLLLAALYAVHIPTFVAARLMSFISLLGLGWIFSCLVPRGEYRPTFYSAIILFIVLQLPFWAALTGFSVYLFTFVLFLALLGFWQDRYCMMIACGLIACLVRPDGCIYIAPLVVAYWLLNPSLAFRAGNLVITAAAVIGGLGYFLWRWHYFGLPLPLPFYVKSDCQRIGLICPSSIEKHVAVIVFFAPIFLYIVPAMKTLERRLKNKLYAVGAAFIAAPLTFYATMNLTQNIALRFYFPIMLASPLLATTVYRRSSSHRFWVLMALCTALQTPVHIKEFFLATTPAGILNIAKALGSLSYKGKVMTSEAGVLAYYSGWETFDTVGLNTPSVAIRRFRSDDVAMFKPDLIVLTHSALTSSDENGLALVRNTAAAVNQETYLHFRMRELAHFPSLASRLNWRRLYTNPFAQPVVEFWINRESPASAALQQILESNGATQING